MKPHLFLATALSLGLSGAAFAQGASTAVVNALAAGLANDISAQAPATATAVPVAIPNALKMAEQSGMKIQKQFAAAAGMNGWLLQGPEGAYTVVYTPPAGEVVIAGTMLGPDGQDLTQAYLSQYGNFDKFAPRLEAARAVVSGAQGDAVKSVIYGFLDTNCIYCHYAHQALEPYQAAGLQVRWLPVAILGGSSAGQAAAILSAQDPGAALAQHNLTWNPQKGLQGIAPMANIPADIKQQLDANVQLMSEMGGSGTPMMLYQDASGHWQRVNGMPRLSELPKITGLPEQVVSNPALQRFR